MAREPGSRWKAVGPTALVEGEVPLCWRARCGGVGRSCVAGVGGSSSDSLVRLLCEKMVGVKETDGQSPIAGARRESGTGAGNLSPLLAAPIASAGALPAYSNSVVPSVPLGNLPGTSAAGRAFPPTGCLSSSLSGRRESAASPGNLPGQASAVRAFPAAAQLFRGRGNPTACTSGKLSGQHLSARAFPAGSSGVRSRGNPTACTSGILPGQHFPVRAFPAGKRGHSPTTMSSVDNSRGVQDADMPPQRAACCPVVPLETTDELRVLGPGSLTAVRPAPSLVPEVEDIAAAARRAMTASARPGAGPEDEEDVSELEDGAPPFGEGRFLNTGPLSIAAVLRLKALGTGQHVAPLVLLQSGGYVPAASPWQDAATQYQ